MAACIGLFAQIACIVLPMKQVEAEFGSPGLGGAFSALVSIVEGAPRQTQINFSQA